MANLNLSSWGHPQQKVGKTRELSGMVGTQFDRGEKYESSADYNH